MKTQILIGHNMRMQKSTVNVFNFDKSLMALVSDPVVNITWKRWCSWLGASNMAAAGNTAMFHS